ncbi:ABC transporter ATP-binding protein [Actinomyces sp. Z5]|uniref:ABC transporter ATP-binding protein n=1 Tax=Actinomyces sp. Z5 TaxID=2250216 RepID=UPI000DCB680D|nr:ABC transporter ATP-binding protein [Actinomyces sp. Z5]RAX22543.1 ABC transporter ATP-binding protein [Actinomyces sp. Z5]
MPGTGAPAARGQVLVAARDLSVGYGEHAVCGPATFVLRAGEALALVGVNGAGKSTLLRTCLGLLPPVDGEVRLLGRIPDPRSGRQRRAVARELGEESFFPALTVAEHLALVCFGHAVPDPERTARQLLEEFDLIDLADALPEEMSSGQRRRLALAAVLARPRRILVLDEPEQRLDHVTRRALAQRLVAERETGVAVLIACHDAEFVRTVATSVLLVGADTNLLDVSAGVRAITEGRL